MQKVKDLVHVIVDNAFLNFPIDEERYELFARVEYQANGTLQGLLGYWLDTSDSRVKDELREIGTQLTTGAFAYWKVSYSDARHEVTSSTVRDLSNRFIAALVDHGYNYTCGDDLMYDLHRLIAMGWHCVSLSMKSEPGFVST